MENTTTTRHTDEYYMKKALSLAKRAAKIGEVPIGCVIVCNDEIEVGGQAVLGRQMS